MACCSNLSRVYENTLGSKCYFTASFLLKLTGIASRLISLRMMQHATDKLGSDEHSTVEFTIWFGFFWLLGKMIDHLSSITEIRGVVQMSSNFSNSVLQRMSRAKLDYHENTGMGERMQYALNIAQDNSRDYLRGLISALLNTLELLVLSTVLGLTLGGGFAYSIILGTLGLLTVYISSLLGLTHCLNNRENSRLEAQGCMINELSDNFRHALTIKSFNTERDQEEQFANKLESFGKQIIKLGNIRTSIGCVRDLLIGAALIFVMLSSVNAVFNTESEFTEKDFSLILTYLLYFIPPFRNLAENLYDYKTGSIGIQRLDNLDKQLPKRNSLERKQITLEDSRSARFDEIKFENVTFDRNDKSKSGVVRTTKILDKVSFSIKKGESVAIIGYSGSGKSTIVKLLMGHYSPTSGSITVDDSPVESLSSHYRNRLFGLCAQQTSIFHRDLISNINYGSHRAPSEEEVANIVEACHDEKKVDKSSLYQAIDGSQLQDLVSKRVCLTQRGGDPSDSTYKSFEDYAELDDNKGHPSEELPLPSYKDAVVSEGSLSGGEAQRIGIARLILKKPCINILDEITANLDGSTTQQIINVFNNAVDKEASLLVISHDLTTIQGVDRIYLLQDGKLKKVDYDNEALDVFKNNASFGSIMRN